MSWSTRSGDLPRGSGELRSFDVAAAMLVAMGRHGEFDAEQAAELRGRPVEQTIEELGERVFRNPRWTPGR